MKFHFTRKIFTLRSNIVIADESGKTRYTTTKGVATLRGRINLLDVDGKNAAVIQSKLMSWGAAYDISRPGAPAATLREKWGIRRKYKIDAGEDGVIRIKPSLLRRRYRFVHENGDLVAVSRIPWVSFRRRATVDVKMDKFESLVLAATIAVMKTDQDKKDKKDGRASASSDA